MKLETTHRHPKLGNLCIGFTVAHNGQLHIDAVTFKFKQHSTSAYSRIVVFPYWNGEMWRVNFVKRSWSNGMTRDFPDWENPEIYPFIAPVMHFINSPDGSDVLRRALKREQRAIRRALQDLQQRVTA